MLMRSQIFYLSIASIAILILLTIYLLRLNISKSSVIDPTTTPTQAVHSRSMTIIADSSTFSKDSPITATIYIKSDVPVTGYDAKIVFDPNKIKFSKAESVNENFDIYTQNREGELIISGIVPLSKNGFTAPEKVQVVRLEFDPLSTGAVDLNIDFKQGSKSESNIISASSEDILSYVEGTTLHIGDGLRLSLNKPVTVDAETQVTMKELSVPGPECADCMTTVVLEVKRNNKTEKAEFRVGGIAGFMDVQTDVLGYSWHLIDAEKDMVDIVYAKL